MMSSRLERALRLLAAVVADEIWRTEIDMGDETEAFQRLQEFLAGLPAGHVPPEMQTRLREYLVPCWHLFTRSGVTSMAAYKLGRMEAPTWNPPVLTFIIERHGGTVLGSVHAELQEWQVNLETRMAGSQTVRRRQKRPKQAAVNVEPIADDLARLILTGAPDQRLRWLKDGRAQVLTDTVPDRAAPDDRRA